VKDLQFVGITTTITKAPGCPIPEQREGLDPTALSLSGIVYLPGHLSMDAPLPSSRSILGLDLRMAAKTCHFTLHKSLHWK
jgi:hypothetical protein